MTTFFAVLLSLLVWVSLGVFVALCVGAGNGNAGDVASLPKSCPNRRGRFSDFLMIGDATMDIETFWNSLSDKSELTAVIENQELRIKQLEGQLRFQHEVLEEICELVDEKTQTPLQNMGMIRIKAEVALRAATKSSLLSKVI